MSDHQPRISVDDLEGGAIGVSELDQAIASFAAAAVRASAVDPFITELIRLRCAQYHDCRLCGSLRLEDARQMGLDEAVAAKIARYETSDLSDDAKAALRLADAIIVDPGSADEELAADLHRHFSDEQIVELCLDVIKWSQQKALVALRLEEPSWDGLAALSFDARGDHVIGDPILGAQSR
jgi:hypothetical protein